MPATGTLVDQVTPGYFSPDADRRSVVDRAHRGDIEGALGTVSSLDTGPRSRVRRLVTHLAIMGPGLVVMVADNDAGGGARPTLRPDSNTAFVSSGSWRSSPGCCTSNQEMAGRLGAVTGSGHARLIVERFLALALAGIGIATSRSRPRHCPRAAGDATWTMPPIDSLGPPDVSRARTLSLVVLRCYLAVSVVARAVKAARIVIGS